MSPSVPEPPAAAVAAAIPAAPPSLATRANLVTLVRTCLAFVVVAMLYAGSELYVGAFALTLVAIWMDAADGWVARRFGEESRLGAVIDILFDRVVEMIYWIVFAALGWLPVWVPLVVVVRGLLVDGVRALAFERGLTAFGSTTMMKSPLGRLLVSSRFSRSLYGVSKALAFSLMILAYAAGLPAGVQEVLLAAALVAVYFSVFLCVARGIPVLAEAKRLV
ncbi:MAG TPA: CDP-alcohol phosphatidyltransferase family protein [Longimicrobiaceae bacterium]|nr:CDP-alcohol phosphatidyltransferase family protein [Longimicrobiaceae bacterium]